ncbi:MAG: hypothetical protein WCV72_02070 [Patescibacteria group bacterium]|jgi:hypothetical protein
MFRRKKKSQIPAALVISGLALFITAGAYVIVKLDAVKQRPQELPLVELDATTNATEENSNQSFVYFTQNTTDAVSTDQRNWRDAETVLMKYFEEINAGNYTAAVALRTTEFLASSPEAYAAQLENSMKNDISGKLKITEIERIPNESKLTTKYFRFRKDAVWSFDGTTHSEIRKAAVVLRDGKWTIDLFEIERKF